MVFIKHSKLQQHSLRAEALLLVYIYGILNNQINVLMLNTNNELYLHCY